MGINDFSKAPIQDEVDFANLPEQFGASQPPPQPGAFRFRLPKPLPDAAFDKVNSETYGERAKVKFDDNAPLLIVQSPKSVYNGEPFNTTITNVPRPRDKEKKVIASDWDYLNQALGFVSRPKSNWEYCTALQAKAGEGAEFNADIEWSWQCRADRPARFSDGQGGRGEQTNAETGQPQLGCGRRYYQNKVSKVQDEAGESVFPLYIACECGADIRAFANLSRFRK
jgi:hypothetical protein